MRVEQFGADGDDMGEDDDDAGIKVLDLRSEEEVLRQEQVLRDDDGVGDVQEGNNN